MVSRRAHWDLAPNPLAVALARRGRAGLLDLTVSNPTTAGLTYPREDLLAALAQPQALRYEPEARGLASARAAVSRYYAEERGVAVDPEHLVLTASTSEAYGFLFKLLCDPGDRVLVPQPSYPLFEFLARLEAVEVDGYPLHWQDGWHLDVNALAAAVTARTRAVMLVSPNNPTGSFVKQHELAALRALCDRHGLALIADEVFGDFGFGADPERVATLAGERAVPAFVLSGLSKVCALPQLKLGWIAVAGPEPETSIAGLELIADTYLSVGTPVQHATPALLAARGPLQAQIRERTRANLEHLRAAVAGTACTLLAPEGGWYAPVRVPAVRDELAWALALLEDGVYVHPGHFFDFAAEAYIVLSLLTPEAIFAQGVERILARVRGWTSSPR